MSNLAGLVKVGRCCWYQLLFSVASSSHYPLTSTMAQFNHQSNTTSTYPRRLTRTTQETFVVPYHKTSLNLSPSSSPTRGRLNSCHNRHPNSGHLYGVVTPPKHDDGSQTRLLAARFPEPVPISRSAAAHLSHTTLTCHSLFPYRSLIR